MERITVELGEIVKQGMADGKSEAQMEDDVRRHLFADPAKPTAPTCRSSYPTSVTMNVRRGGRSRRRPRLANNVPPRSNNHKENLAMPSFDVVSKVDMAEVDNAINGVSAKRSNGST